MNKYIQYSKEILGIGDIQLFKTTFNYFFFKELPARDMLLQNPIMGSFLCRKQTTDFMFSLFSYEYKIKSRILSMLDEMDYYIDIGACIGDYSIWMSRNGLKCIAFEPNPDNYRSLTNNIRLNHLENNITALPFGLGSSEESLTFETHPTNRGYSGKSLKFEGGYKQKVYIKVFDQVFRELGLPLHKSYVVKIDVEGMEEEVIKGAVNFLSRVKKVLLIFEAHTNKQQVLDRLSSITSFDLVEMDDLNVGVLIEHPVSARSSRNTRRPSEIS